jgi:2-polyprenyl-3-methyl-5-hydroxy-6-metoxy-1,4-benzoquinol methylase
MSDHVEAIAEGAAAYYIGRVKRKLAAGIYQTVPVACFCGSSNAVKLTDFDRYGFDHKMHLCKECGVIYANPRMTEDSYAKFYEQEYRYIYDENEEDDTAEAQFVRGQQVAEALRDYLVEQYEFKPTTVFDIGCNAGAWLQPFLDAGAQVHGVDYGPERVSFGRDRGLPIEIGSIETLEILGTKADLILMNHVLEHATDIESMLKRIHGLLSDDGMLYVGMPGLFACQLDRLFQNAHPWQFTAETLIYVMECCGFEEVRADHTITSLWKKSDVCRDKRDLPNRQFVRDIANFVSKGGLKYVPNIRAVNKFPLAERKKFVASAVSRNLPDIADLINKHVGQEAIVIGGGPSIETHVETIKAKQQAGGVVLAIERMLPWCTKHGLTPHYVVAQDASDDVVEAFETIPDGLTYLVASQCKPSVFDALAGESVYLFHSSKKGFTEQELDGVSPSKQRALVNAGGSVVICSLSIAMMMGMKRIHLFGFDCHVTNGHYAKGIAGVGEMTNAVKIKVDGKSFTTTFPYIAFAQQFFELREIGKAEGLLEDIRVYGDSLVIAMSQEDLCGK